MQIAFRDLPVLDNAGSTRNFEQLQALLNPVWREPLFEHAWKNLEASRKAEYRRNLFGNVELRGAIASGEIGKSAFTLPVGYRPKERKDLPATTNNGVAGRVIVVSSGEVQIGEPAGSEPKAATFLDSVFFAVA